MVTYNSLINTNTKENTAVALGYFDGVHKGHKLVLNAAKKAAEQNNLQSTVFTFSLSKTQNIKGGKIFSENENKRRVESLGFINYYCPPFESFCNLMPEEFVKHVLIEKLNAKQVFCGENFMFGKNKSGDINTLKMLCEKYKIKVNVLGTVKYKGEDISSTRIRNSLLQGDINSVNEMLEEPYNIDFSIMHGNKIGSTMGFPTINQTYPNDMTQPKSGVYITSVEINGVCYAAATGLGNRPTFNGENVTCETFIINFNKNLYGENIVVSFYEYLKPTVKFNTKQELENYIKSAVEKSIDYFNTNGII